MKQLVLHCHHRLLFETLTEPLRNRIKYIKEEKPEHEVETRLGAIRILTPAEVKTIPKGVMKKLEAYNKAMEAYYKTEEAYDKTWEAYDKAMEARDKAMEAYDKAGEVFHKACNTPAMIKWHKKICKYDGCTWDGETLFPGE